jgi:hypothetical protein
MAFRIAKHKPYNEFLAAQSIATQELSTKRSYNYKLLVSDKWDPS